MKEDAIKELWQQNRPELHIEPGRLLASLVTADDFGRRLEYQKGVRKSATAGLAALSCFGVLFLDMSLWAQTGAVTMAVCLILIILTLHKVHQQISIPEPTMALRQLLIAEERSLISQLKAKTQIYNWYLPPLVLGTQVFFYGLDVSVFFKIAFLTGSLFLAAYSYHTNKKTVEHQLNPLLKKLQENLRQL